MKISVVIPAYNGEKFIIRALSSVAVQNVTEDLAIECLCVNDGSKDDTASVVRQFIAEYQGNMDTRMAILNNYYEGRIQDAKKCYSYVRKSNLYSIDQIRLHILTSKKSFVRDLHYFLPKLLGLYYIYDEIEKFFAL